MQMISSFAKMCLCFFLGITMINSSEFALCILVVTCLSVFIYLFKKESVFSNLIKSLSLLFLAFLSGHFYANLYQKINTPNYGDSFEIEKAEIKLEQVKNYSYAKICKGNLRINANKNLKIKLTIYGDSRTFMEGTTLLINKLQLSKIYKSQFLYKVDFNEILLAQGFHYQSTINSSDILEIREKQASGLGIAELKETLKLKLKSKLKSNYDLVSAICLGDKTDLDLHSKQLFISNGIAHIMAVSGLHIGILFMLIVFLFKRIRIDGKIIGIALTLLLIWFFIALTDFPVSAIRAGLMISIYCIFKLLGRKNEKTHVLAFTAFIILIWDPGQIYSIGFLLSFFALIGILYFSESIKNIYKPKFYLVSYVWEIIVISLAVQITTLPLILYYFHSFPLHFLLTNVLAIPFAFLVLILFIVFSIFGFIEWVSIFISYLLNRLIDAFLSVLSWFEQFDFLYLNDLYLFKFVLLIYYSSLLYFLIFANKIVQWKKIAIAISIAFIAFTGFHKAETFENETYLFYDKGISILYKTGLSSTIFTKNESFNANYYHPIIRKNLKIESLKTVSKLEFKSQVILINPLEKADFSFHETCIIICDYEKACKIALELTEKNIYVPKKLKRKFPTKRVIELADFIEI